LSGEKKFRAAIPQPSAMAVSEELFASGNRQERSWAIDGIGKLNPPRSGELT